MSIQPPHSSTDSGLNSSVAIEKLIGHIEGLLKFWPNTCSSDFSRLRDLAKKSFLLTIFIWTQKLSDTAIQMRKRSWVSLGPESKILQKISMIFPKAPVTEENFLEMFEMWKQEQEEELYDESSITQILIYTLNQSMEELFNPPVYRHLVKIVDHPVAATLLKRIDRDFFLRLPGNPENALHTGAELQKRIAGSDEVRGDPDIHGLQVSLENEIEAVVDEKGRTLFAQRVLK